MPTEISGLYLKIYRGLKEKGIKIDYLCSYHPFEYAKLSDYSNILFKMFFLFSRFLYFYSRRKKGIFSFRKFLFFIFLLLKVIIFFYLLFHYDVFIFTFGNTLSHPSLPFFRELELKILKFFKKRIIFFVMHGSELRPPYIESSFYMSNSDLKDKKLFYLLKKLTYSRKRNAELIEKYADVIVSAYFMSHFLKRDFIDYHSFAGNMVEEEILFRSYSESNLRKDNNKIVILHAPSVPEAKGTPKIREAIKKLKNKYPNIEYVELTGKTNKEVLEAIKNSDIVVDQLYSTTPLAMFAIEAGSMGKPVIVGSYIWKKHKEVYSIIPPVYLCHPDKIEEAIEELIIKKDLREKLGKELREFIVNNLRLELIVEKFLKVIKGDIPLEWIKKPIDNYAHIAFTEENIGKEVLKRYIELFGDSALCLDDKPQLKKAFLDFVGF